VIFRNGSDAFAAPGSPFAGQLCVIGELYGTPEELKQIVNVRHARLRLVTVCEDVYDGIGPRGTHTCDLEPDHEQWHRCPLCLTRWASPNGATATGKEYVAAGSPARRQIGSDGGYQSGAGVNDPAGEIRRD
jgi:hypothetical protein